MENEVALKGLSERLAHARSHFERVALLDDSPSVARCLEKYPFLKPFLAGLTPECESAFKQMIAAGQADRLFAGMDAAALQSGALRELLSKLLEIDQFYRELGGIVGYQAKVLEILNAPEAKEEIPSVYHSPHFIDMTEESEEVEKAVSWGIDALPEMAEFYPLGGARLPEGRSWKG